MTPAEINKLIERSNLLRRLAYDAFNRDMLASAMAYAASAMENTQLVLQLLEGRKRFGDRSRL